MPVNTLSRKREEKEKCAKRAGGEKKALQMLHLWFTVRKLLLKNKHWS